MSRRSLVLIGALAAVLTLATGCGAGQIAETDKIQSAISGINGNAGDMAIRNALVAYPTDGVAQKGGSAELLMTLVNTSLQAQQLVSVSTSAAAGTELSLDASSSSDSDSSPSASTSASTDASASASASASGSASTSPTTSPSTSASASPSASTDNGELNLTVPAQGYVQLTLDGEFIKLTGLTQDLVSGRTIPVTFVFSNGSTVSLQVPITVPEQATSPVPAPSPTEGLGEPAT